MSVNAVAVLFATLAGVFLLSNGSDLFYSFSAEFYQIVSICFVLFCGGYVFTRFLVPSSWLQAAASPFEAPQVLAKRRHSIFVLMFVAFSLLGFLDRFLMFGPGFFLPETVMQYRIFLTQEGGAGIIKGLSLGNFFIFLMPTYLVAFSNRFTRGRLVLMLLLFLADIYLSSARSSLFLSALIAFYFWAFSKTLTAGFVVKVCLLMGILVGGFTLIGEIVGKSSDELGILVYAAAPLHAFDELLAMPALLDEYRLTFFPVQGVLGSIFGFAASNELPNILTPLPTNVYSMYGVFFSDYGLPGLFIALFTAGFFSGFVEGVYKTTRLVSFRVYAALNLAILSLSVFYDYYTTSGVVWMTFILTPFFFIDAFPRSVLNTSNKRPADPFSVGP